MIKNANKGVLVVLSGPSGTGKGTICKALCAKTGIQCSISATTRQPRAGEQNGKEYFFVAREDFLEMIEHNGLLEWAQVYDNYYGTPKTFVEQVLNNGNDCILEIDPQGALKVRQAMPEAILIFVAPPSLSELRKRIEGRGTETLEEINKRMACAESEMAFIRHYDYVIINDEISKAVGQMESILVAERCRVLRCYNQIESQS